MSGNLNKLFTLKIYTYTSNMTRQERNWSVRDEMIRGQLFWK